MHKAYLKSYHIIYSYIYEPAAQNSPCLWEPETAVVHLIDLVTWLNLADPHYCLVDQNCYQWWHQGDDLHCCSMLYKPRPPLTGGCVLDWSWQASVATISQKAHTITHNYCFIDKLWQNSSLLSLWSMMKLCTWSCSDWSHSSYKTWENRSHWWFVATNTMATQYQGGLWVVWIWAVTEHNT